ncbi:MAG: hypothetical protein Q9169_004591 [Polycauliona sp. 2 TL-2023]
MASISSNDNYTPEADSSDMTVHRQFSEVRKPSGFINGTSKKYQFDGANSPPTTASISHTSEQHVTILRETVSVTTQSFVADFDDVDEHHIHGMTIEQYFEHIERLRLTHMPHRGSHWDKVLKWAEFFGLQISDYAHTVEPYVAESKLAARLIWTACRVLLDLGPDNAQALETTFAVFYNLGLSIAFLLRRQKLLTASDYLRSEVGHSFNDLLILVRDVSLYYRVKLFGGAQETAFDFNAVFGRQISSISKRKAVIVNAMWEHVLGHQSSTQIHTVRNWLQPADRVLQNFGMGRQATAGGRDDSITVAKRLLLQLLDLNVGNKEFFRMLVEVHQAAHSSNPEAAQKSVWKCVDVGLDQYRSTEHLMFMIDGLDEFEGGHRQTTSVANQLASLAAKHKNVQFITCSRGTIFESGHGKICKFVITADHTHEDLRLVIDNALHGQVHFDHQSEHGREKIVGQLLQAAKGNFLEAIMTVFLLKRETTQEGFNKLLKTTSESKVEVNDLIVRLINTIDLSSRDVHNLLSWMLVTRRPLTFPEVHLLFQVDLAKGSFVDLDAHAIATSMAVIKPFVNQENGFIRFRHSIVRQHMFNIQKEGKKLRNRRDAQADFTMRLLAYCHFNLGKPRDPILEALQDSEVAELFARYGLLEYTVTHWIQHFRSSSFQQDDGPLQLTSELKAIFPGSTRLPLLEWSCWRTERTPSEANPLFELALQVRQEVLTRNHQAVLQVLIAYGEYHKSNNEIIKASDCFYRASKISQQLLRKYHAFTISCATTFLTTTETFTVTSRTDIASRKEELLVFLLETHKHQLGKTHDLVIRYYKVLAQLYTDMHEEQHAERIWREVREIVITRFGKGSQVSDPFPCRITSHRRRLTQSAGQEETTIAEHLTIVLKKGGKKTDVIEYERGIFDIVTELEVWDIRRIRMTLELAWSYEQRGEILMAEELFLMLWRKLTDQCHHYHHHHGVDIHIRTIDIVIEYVHLLRRCHRDEEAANVLICIWSEYEDYEFESETLFLRLKVVGQLMREISLLAIAISVFRKCLVWFKSHGKYEQTRSCEMVRSETMVEMVRSTSVTTTTTTSTELVVRELFESTLTRTTVTSETVTIFKHLISYYMKLELWTEAIETIKRSLYVIWKAIVTGSGTIALPEDFGKEAIEMAIFWAICHRRSQQYHEAQEIYVRIYHACRNSCRIDDERLTNAYTTLVELYEAHHHWRKVVELHQEMLAEYRSHLGSQHHLTIRTLYVLGSSCSEHGHGNGYEYYQEIIEVLGNGDDDDHDCHPDALEAAMWMCRWHYEMGHWHKLRTVCRILWDTWRHQHAGYDKFTADFVELLYSRYRYVLEHHVHVEYTVIRELTLQYRYACVKSFGVSMAITIKAMVELANYSMKVEKHLHEAVSLYEEILTHVETLSKTKSTTTIITTSTVTQVRERLTQAYLQVCSHTSVSIQTIERAIKAVLHRYESLQSTIGWSHTETLTVLRELIVLHMKLKKPEAINNVQRMLLEATSQIISREKQSRVLHEAGKLIGQIFVTCGLTSYGHDLISELRLQIITGNVTSSNKFAIKTDRPVGRVSFVFLVTLEQIIRDKQSTSYASVMADYITESVLCESYNRSIKAFSTRTLGHAARLRALLLHHKRLGQIDHVEKQSFEMFSKKWSFHAPTHIQQLLYVSLLEHIGDDFQEIDVGDITCRASVAKVSALLKNDQTQEAYEVAHCAFRFSQEQHSYHKSGNVRFGFKLAGLMVLLGLDRPIKANVDAKLHQNMRQLSQEIIREVLKCCRESHMDFVRLPLSDLNGLIALLGKQQNYADLEWILELLWKCREVQKSWRADTIIEIGRHFVQARYLNASKERRSEAIRLCEDICYNLGRVWGTLDPKTLEMSDLLSQLYTNMGHTREAQGVHENILRLVTEGDDGDDRTLDTMDSRTARHQVELLKQSYLRLRGWDKTPEIYAGLIHDLKSMPEYRSQREWADVKPANEWNPKETASETVGKFEAPQTWYLVKPENFNEKGEIKEPQKISKRPGMSAKRVTSNWGMNFVNNLIHGGHENGLSNGGHKKVDARNGSSGHENASEEAEEL